MNWKRFSDDTRLRLAGNWLAGKHHDRLAAIPKTAVHLDDLRAVRDAILAARKSPNTGPLTQKLADNRAKATASDRRHDRKARGTAGLLENLADLCDDPNEARAYLALRDRLFPRGLTITLLSYDEEAGNVAQVQTELDPQTRAELKRIKTTKDRNLDQDVHDWIAAGQELGRLEDERRDLEAALAKAGAPRPIDAVAAQNRWIKVMRAIVAAIESAELPAEEEAELLAALREAERKYAERGGDEEDAPEPPAAEPASASGGGK